MLRCAMGVLTLALSLPLISTEASGLDRRLPQNNRFQSTEAGSLTPTGLTFTKNMGQWPDSILYRTSAGGAAMWFTSTGVIYQFTRRVERAGTESVLHFRDPYSTSLDLSLGGLDTLSDSLETMLIKATFVGANTSPEVIPEGLTDYKCNYFLGNEPAKWRTNVPNYNAILIHDVYPGIDVRFAGESGQLLKYEYIASQGADLSQVKVVYEGDIDTVVDGSGKLLVKTAWGTILESVDGSGSLSESPLLHLSQGSSGAPRVINSGQASSQAGAMTLVYSTYLGGSSSDDANNLAVDSSGAVYLAGKTTSADFPVLDAYQDTLYSRGGYYDAFVTKISSSGSSLVYSTYLGGGGHDEAMAIEVDSAGQIYITGYLSGSFPMTNPAIGYCGVEDVFVTKISESGDSLIYSTCLGSTYVDLGWDIAVNQDGAAYVAGITYSGFMPVVNPIQATWGGKWDALVFKLTAPGDSLVFCTYLGGDEDDYSYEIVLDSTGAAYVAGFSCSAGFPTSNAYQDALKGDCDAVVLKMSSNGDSLIYSTYLGGSGTDMSYKIAVDLAGVAYVTGVTNSADFPLVDEMQGHQGGDDAFVAELSSSGDSLLFSTCLGGSEWDMCSGIILNQGGGIYVSGGTQSSDFPTVNPFQDAYGGTRDSYLAKFSRSTGVLVYSTYIGGSGDDGLEGIAMDKSGAIYAAGFTNSPDFPVLDEYQAHQGMRDAFLMKFKSEGCCFGRVGNPNELGDYPDEVSLGDVMFLVDALFVSDSCDKITCLLEADADQSGGSEPTCDDITLGDILILVDYLFITGPQNARLMECL